MKYNHLFGPVASRRLGLSLGVDLLPYKTCSLNCVYCECGGTTNLTAARKTYVPTQEVLDELDDYLSSEPPLDFVTFSGAGEPLLHRGVGTVVRHLRERYPLYKRALLTSGTLFHDPEALEAALQFDLVIPSLDAVTEPVFAALNRPAPGLTLELVLQGLDTFFRRFEGEVWLEIFIVPGLNDDMAHLEALVECVTRFRPHRVQLNSLDRPGTEGWVKSVDPVWLQEIAALFPRGEIVSKGVKVQGVRPQEVLHMLVSSLRRRPQTREELEQTLELHPLELEKALAILTAQGRLREEQRARGLFFVYREIP